MVIAGLALTGIAAIVHVFIFYLESLAWMGPRARAVFGTTLEEARVSKELAFNQGFYNLFLAILVVLGIVAMLSGTTTVGATLICAGAGSMVAAALVLFVSNRELRPAAAKQGILPALGLFCLLLGLAL